MRKFFLFFFLLLSLHSFSQSFHSDSLRQKLQILRIFLQKHHYAPLNWNDSSSAMLYRHWLNELDDEKIFFTRAEINQLQQYKNSLDEEMNGGGWGFFDKSIALYRQAVKNYDSVVNAILLKPVDFTKAETIHYPFTDYAANAADLQQRIQQLLKWKIIRGIMAGMDSAALNAGTLIKQPVDLAVREKKSRDRVKKQQQMMTSELLKRPGAYEAGMAEHYLQAVSWCYDPHTMYMDMSEKKNFETALSGFEYSTGMNIEQNDDGDYAVQHLEPGGSAWRSGELHKGDVVVAVKKGKEEEKELAEMDEEEVKETLGGNSDEKVQLTVKSAAGTTRKVELSKEKVTDDEGIVKSYVIRGDKNYGYIKLPGFYSREDEDIESMDDLKYDGCANDVSKEIVKLKRDTIAGLILDLRFNGGGSMWEAMQLAGIFIDYGPVASVKDKTGKVQFLKDPNRGTAYDGPLLVLINGASASASELTGAVLQDYKRALIAGSTTYGKGTAQAILPLDTAWKEDAGKKYDDFGDFVKVTEEKFYRIDGSTTQWTGVKPDIALPDIFQYIDYRESKNESALQPDQAKRGIYQPLTGIPYEMLRQKSGQRTAADSFFINTAQLSSFIAAVEKGRDVPLQWQSYATYYRNSMLMFAKMEKLDKGIASIAVTNNNFDQEKIKFATERGKALNEKYIRNIASDAYVIEAFHILQDWINH